MKKMKHIIQCFIQINKSLNVNILYVNKNEIRKDKRRKIKLIHENMITKSD